MARLTQNRLREVLSYDEDDGVFTWRQRTSNRVKVGDVAGCLNKYGYQVISVDGRLYQASHLAWLYAYGVLPNEIDHRNRRQNDNRLLNLRECKHFENMCNRTKQKNNTSGIKNVYWHPAARKWRVRVGYKGKVIHIGLYESLDDAAIAQKTALAEIHKDYAAISKGVDHR